MALYNTGLFQGFFLKEGLRGSETAVCAEPIPSVAAPVRPERLHSRGVLGYYSVLFTGKENIMDYPMPRQSTVFKRH